VELNVRIKFIIQAYMQKKKKKLSKFHTLLVCSVYNQNLLKKNVEQNICVC
jgi:hypothetical protein